LRIEPIVNKSTSLIYFTPPYVDLDVDGGCFPRLSFAAKKGIIIEGSVIPGIEKVVITATGDSQLG
jgi:hypothetical protein